MKTSERKAGLGVMVSNISGDDDSKNTIKGGAQIIEVFEGSEAEAIGLKKGDILVELNGCCCTTRIGIRGSVMCNVKNQWGNEKQRNFLTND